MKNDPETYSVQCPNCAAEHCFPTRKAVAAFTKDWKSTRFESLCRKNRKLILKALLYGADRCEQAIWAGGDLRRWKPAFIKITALRDQLMEAK